MILVSQKSYKNISETQEISSADVIARKFEGDGTTFKCKIIGVQDIATIGDEQLCLELMNKLKTAVRALGEHKQKITFKITMNRITIMEQSTQIPMAEQEVLNILFVVLDPVDPRAFGYIYKTSDDRHQFWAIKTERPAVFVGIALKELFELAYRAPADVNTLQTSTDIDQISSSSDTNSIDSGLKSSTTSANSNSKLTQSSKSSCASTTIPENEYSIESPARKAPFKTNSSNNVWGEQFSTMDIKQNQSFSFDNPWENNFSTMTVEETFALKARTSNYVWEDDFSKMSFPQPSKSDMGTSSITKQEDCSSIVIPHSLETAQQRSMPTTNSCSVNEPIVLLKK